MSYWDNTGEHQALADALGRLVPMMGEVPDAANNPKLEKFRKASGVYYDVFNNGLCNRGAEFRPTFKLKISDYYKGGRPGWHRPLDFDRLKVDLEAPMSAYVLAAAFEQLARLPLFDFSAAMAEQLNRLPAAREPLPAASVEG